MRSNKKHASTPRPLLFVAWIFCLELSSLQQSSYANAQATNGTYTLLRGTMTSAGGITGSAATKTAETCLGLPASGLTANGSFRLTDGLGENAPVAEAPITAAITITGNVSDAAATITVNGVAAVNNGTTFTANGIKLLLGPNAINAIATDAVGNSSSQSAVVYLDLPAAKKTPRFTVTVRGTINDPAAVVSVNDVPGTINNGAFAADVPLVNGLNTLTATATDAAGNTAIRSLRVFVPPPTQLPPMPTAGYDLPAFTTDSSVLVSGTKTKGTSIWINGQQVVAANDLTTWSATVNLVEGDNPFRIVAKDAAGASSATATINVIQDNLAPVITVPAAIKTNLNPYPFTGKVDDSLTAVTVNGLTATNTGGTFSVSIPLAAGTTTASIRATSPRSLLSNASTVVTLGHVPTLQTVTPADRTKFYAGKAVSFSATASDAENDPMQFRLTLNDAVLRDWNSAATLPWTPSLSQIGAGRIRIEVRDDFGGSNTKEQDGFVLRQPVQHP